MRILYSFNFILVFFGMATLLQTCLLEGQQMQNEIRQPYPDLNKYVQPAKDFLPMLKAGKLAPVLKTMEDTDFAVSYVELQLEDASRILNTYPLPPDSLITAEYIPERGYIEYHFYFTDEKNKSHSAEINVLVTYNHRSKGKISMFGANKYRVKPAKNTENVMRGVESISPI